MTHDDVMTALIINEYLQEYCYTNIDPEFKDLPLDQGVYGVRQIAIDLAPHINKAWDALDDTQKDLFSFDMDFVRIILVEWVKHRNAGGAFMDWDYKNAAQLIAKRESS